MGSDTDSSQPRVVQASEILAKIESGVPVEYDGVFLEGDLDLSGLGLPIGHVARTEYEIEHLGLAEEAKVVKSPISITNSELRGDLNFSNIIFRKSVDFVGTFFGIQFSSGTNFRGAQFSDSAVFKGARFSGNAGFFKAQFGGDAHFGGVQFNGDAYFGWAQFSSYAWFDRARFGGFVHFRKVQFSCDDANFIGAQFSGDVDFREAQFSGSTYFMDARFSDNRNSVSNFENTSFNGSTSFVDTQFGSYTDFRAAQFNNNNSLDLVHARFDRLEIEWDSIHHLNCDGTVYIALVRNFRDLAQFDDADDCYYKYRDEIRAQKKLYCKKESWDWSKLLDIIAWISCGYGVRPIHTIFCMFGVVFISWIIFLGYFDSVFESFYFSLMTFTGGKPNNLETEHWLRSVAMIEAILGYLFMALFVVVLARKLIR